MTERVLPNAIEALPRGEVLRDISQLVSHRSEEFLEAGRAQRERLKHQGLKIPSGLVSLTLEPKQLADVYFSILNHNREGVDMSLVLLRASTQLFGKGTRSLPERLDHTLRYSQAILSAINGKRPPIWNRSSGLETIVSTGIFAPYALVFEEVVRRRQETKNKLKQIQSATIKSASRVGGIAETLDQNAEEISKAGDVHDSLMAGFQEYEQGRLNIARTITDFTENVAARKPLAGNTRQLAGYVIDSTKMSMNAIEANRALEQLFGKLAFVSSLSSEQAALIAAHRAGVISLGTTLTIYTSLPFMLGEIVAAQIETLQLLNLHLLYKVQEKMLSNRSLQAYINLDRETQETEELYQKISTPQGTKDAVIDAQAKCV